MSGRQAMGRWPRKIRDTSGSMPGCWRQHGILNMGCTRDTHMDAHMGSTLADYHILNFVSVIFVIVDGWRIDFISGTR